AILAALALPALETTDSAIIARCAELLRPENRDQKFRTMDTIYPYHVIKRAGPVHELPRATRRLDVSYRFAGEQHSLDDLLERVRTQGFLVIKDGKIADERYFDGASDKSRFTSFSGAKSFTSTLVGLALADGKIASLDDAVTKYVPELKGSG